MSANISQFLEVFKTAMLGSDNFKEDICAAVLEKTKFPIEKNCIDLKNNCISIKADPYMKTEIMMQKENILKAIQQKYPKKNIREIF